MNRREKLTVAGVCLALALAVLANARVAGPYRGHVLFGATTVTESGSGPVVPHRLDQHNVPTAAVAMNSQKLTGLASGTASGDAVHFGQTASSSTAGLESATDKDRFDRCLSLGPSRCTWEMDDFEFAGENSSGAVTITSTHTFGKLQFRTNVGTNGSVLSVTTAGDQNHKGIIDLRTVTTTSTFSAVLGFPASTPNFFLASGGAGITNRRQWKARWPTLSDGTNTIEVQCGWGDTGNATQANGVFIDLTSASPSSGNFILRTCSASSCTTCPGGSCTGGSTVTASANTWYQLEVTDDGTNACGSVDGTSLGCTTSTRPSAAIGDVCMQLRSAGTAQRDVLLDWVLRDDQYTTPR